MVAAISAILVLLSYQAAHGADRGANIYCRPGRFWPMFLDRLGAYPAQLNRNSTRKADLRANVG